jgi:hypothetical protein
MRKLTATILSDEEIAFRTERLLVCSGAEGWFRVTK